MNIGVVGILIIFAVFIVLVATNPRLSCFGRKLKSPFYPLFRRKRLEEESRLLRQEKLKNLKTEDYGFKLGDSEGTARPTVSDEIRKKAEKTEDYGLKLD